MPDKVQIVLQLNSQQDASISEHSTSIYSAFDLIVKHWVGSFIAWTGQAFCGHRSSESNPALDRNLTSIWISRPSVCVYEYKHSKAHARPAHFCITEIRNHHSFRTLTHRIHGSVSLTQKGTAVPRGRSSLKTWHVCVCVAERKLQSAIWK